MNEWIKLKKNKKWECLAVVEDRESGKSSQWMYTAGRDAAWSGKETRRFLTVEHQARAECAARPTLF